RSRGGLPARIARTSSGARGSDRAVAPREPGHPPAGAGAEPSALLEAALEAAQAAGAIALGYFRGTFQVSHKADQTPVTQADREAEQAIVERLGAAFPEMRFLGEEYGAQGSQTRRWIVDPIDGTKNFVRGTPYWATLLALEEEGEVTLGVVHAPATGDLFWAQHGRGAFVNGVPLRVSTVDRLPAATLVHSSLNLLRTIEGGRYW